tara:strand:- start:1038 stop:2024 length:987 start_codon:yes stop_codon:yes gene_type:complete
MLNEYSATGIGRFQECRRKYHYEYVDRYEPVKKGEGLRSGTLLHVGQESYWNGHDLDTAMVAMSDEAAKLKYTDDPLLLPKVNSYLRGYYNRWKDIDNVNDLGRYSVLDVEHEFLHPSGVEGVMFAGKIDGILYDTEENTTIMLEHKGTSNKQAQDLASSYWDHLQMNTQLYLYVDYLIKKYNRPVQALWDVTITSPKSKIAGKKKIAKRKSETPEEFEQRKQENTETVGDFEERLTKTYVDDPNRYVRKRIPILEHRLKYKMEEVREVVREMQSDFKPIRNVTACSSFGGCAYMDICLGYTELKDSPRFQKRIKPNKKTKTKNQLPF